MDPFFVGPSRFFSLSTSLAFSALEHSRCHQLTSTFPGLYWIINKNKKRGWSRRRRRKRRRCKRQKEEENKGTDEKKRYGDSITAFFVASFCFFFFFYFVLYSFHGFIYGSFFLYIYFYSSFFIIVFCFLVSLSLLHWSVYFVISLGLFPLSVLTTVIVHNLYTDLLVARRRRSTGKEWKKWKGKNAHERENERRKEIGGREEKERVDTHTIYTRAAHKSGLRIVAASSAARATINSPLLLSALLGSHCVYVVSSLLLASRCFSQWRIVWDLSVLPTSPCFIERSRSLSSLRPFCFSRLRRRGPPTFESCVFNFDLGVTRSREVQCVLHSVARFKKLIYRRFSFITPILNRIIILII